MEENPIPPPQPSQPPARNATQSVAGGPISQIPPISPNGPKKNITFMILIIFITIILISGSSWYFLANNQTKVSEKPLPTLTKTPSPTPTINPTANWKTYSNSNDGYEIEYPSTWSMYEFQNNIGATFIPPGLKTDSAYGVIGISKSKKFLNNNLSFEEYVKVAASNEIQGHEKLLSVEKIITTSSVVGYKTIWQIAKGSPSTYKTSTITYFPFPNDSQYTIQIQMSNDTYNDVYNQILSTFTFTEQNVTGKVEIAPTCAGPGRLGELCSKPFHGAILVKDKISRKDITRFTTNTDGTFTVQLEKGQYIFEPQTNIGIPGRTQQYEVSVDSEKPTFVTITIDTGIR